MSMVSHRHAWSMSTSATPSAFALSTDTSLSPQAAACLKPFLRSACHKAWLTLSEMQFEMQPEEHFKEARHADVSLHVEKLQS